MGEIKAHTMTADQAIEFVKEHMEGCGITIKNINDMMALALLVRLAYISGVHATLLEVKQHIDK